MNREILSIERVGRDYRITARFTWHSGFWIWKKTHESIEAFRGSGTVWHYEKDGFPVYAGIERWLTAAMNVHKWAHDLKPNLAEGSNP